MSKREVSFSYKYARWHLTQVKLSNSSRKMRLVFLFFFLFISFYLNFSFYSFHYMKAAKTIESFGMDLSKKKKKKMFNGQIQ